MNVGMHMHLSAVKHRAWDAAAVLGYELRQAFIELSISQDSPDLKRPLVHCCSMSPRLTMKVPGSWGTSSQLPACMGNLLF